MTQTSLIELLRKHKDSAPDPRVFVKAVAQNCQTHESTVYRWLDGVTPTGGNMLSLVQHLQALKEPKP